MGLIKSRMKVTVRSNWTMAMSGLNVSMMTQPGLILHGEISMVR
jgi:hypothetical protein